MKKIKLFIKKLLFVDFFRQRRCFLKDQRRFCRYSGYNQLNPKTLEAKVILHYHVLEKGLTMPFPHMPFGKQVACTLVGLIKDYIRLNGMSIQIAHAIGVLKEYYEVHKKSGCVENEDSFWVDVLDLIEEHKEVAATKQLITSEERFFADTKREFYHFAHSRHSCRSFKSKTIPASKIKDVISLATTAPSACNRQQIKVICIENKDVAQKVLELQGGSRGFGGYSDKVLVIVSDLRLEFGGTRERYDAYVNGGIFLMNLAYSLHYYNIGHCILSGALTDDAEEEIRDLCSIPRNEVIVSFLCIGEVADEFKVATSPRREVSEVLSFIR